jgi:transcriptional regulator with XRE-family HTH domain
MSPASLTCGVYIGIPRLAVQPEDQPHAVPATASWSSRVVMADENAAERPERESRPSPIDIHVGSRIRMRRTLLGMSQERLGDALGLTFQQVQKYERGVNRVGASRLFDISRVLDVPISYFFDDMPEGMSETPISGPRGRVYGFAEQKEPFNAGVDDQLTKRETLELVRAYYRIPDAAMRKRMFDLMKSLAPPEAAFEAS